MKAFTDYERIARVWDVLEIRNLMARHCYMHDYGQRREDLDSNWVGKVENFASASYGCNLGYVVGIENIQANYADLYDEKHPQLKGEMTMALLTTPMIEISEDGLSAHGLWYSPGQTTIKENGEMKARFIYKKIGADFLKEDGVWKIWHVFEGSDLIVEAGTDLAKLPVDDPMVEYEYTTWQFTHPGMAYTSRYNFVNYPAIPNPYTSFTKDSVITNGLNGSPFVKKEA